MKNSKRKTKDIRLNEKNPRQAPYHIDPIKKFFNKIIGNRMIARIFATDWMHI